MCLLYIAFLTVRCVICLTINLVIVTFLINPINYVLTISSKQCFKYKSGLEYWLEGNQCLLSSNPPHLD